MVSRGLDMALRIILATGTRWGENVHVVNERRCDSDVDDAQTRLDKGGNK